MDIFEYVDIESLSLNGKPEKIINFKPIGSTICMGIVGVILLFLSLWKGFNLWCFVFAVFVILFVAFVVVAVKDRKVVDFYKDGILIYSSENNKKAFFMPYTEMKEWTTKKSDSGCDAVWFKFNDGRQLYKDTFQSAAVYRYLSKDYLDYETNQIKMKELRKKQLSIPEAIARLRERLLKKK